MKDIIKCQPLRAVQSLPHNALLFEGQGMTPNVQNPDQEEVFFFFSHYWTGSPYTLATDCVKYEVV